MTRAAGPNVGFHCLAETFRFWISKAPVIRFLRNVIENIDDLLYFPLNFQIVSCFLKQIGYTAERNLRSSVPCSGLHTAALKVE